MAERYVEVANESSDTVAVFAAVVYVFEVLRPLSNVTVFATTLAVIFPAFTLAVAKVACVISTLSFALTSGVYPLKK